MTIWGNHFYTVACRGPAPAGQVLPKGETESAWTEHKTPQRMQGSDKFIFMIPKYLYYKVISFSILVTLFPYQKNPLHEP